MADRLQACRRSLRAWPHTLALVALLTSALPLSSYSMDNSALTPLGQTSLRFLGLKIYDAELRVGDGFKAEQYAQYPLALTLRYARTLEGKLIAERSLLEMRRLGPISETQAQTWMQWMTRAFPNVRAGDRLTGTHDGNGQVSFWYNDVQQLTVTDAEFAKLFFGIWLHPNTSQPALRLELLGLKG